MLPVLITWGPVKLYSFGVILALAFLLGAFRIWRQSREAHWEETQVFDAILIVGFWGLVGARAAYVATHWQGWLASLAISSYPGLALEGGLVGGILALWALSRKWQWGFWEAADMFMPGLLLAWSISYLGVWLSTRSSNWTTHLPLLGWAFGLLLAAWAGRWEREYRTYDWYKGKRAEGKPGFVFWAGLAGMAGVQTIWDWRWGMVVVLALAGLYLRSERLIMDVVRFSLKRRRRRRPGLYA